MPDGLGPFLCILILLGVLSSVISALLGRLNSWEAVPGASPWRVWGPGILAWSWTVAVAACFLLWIITPWAFYLLVLAPLTLLAATALLWWSSDADMLRIFWRRRLGALRNDTNSASWRSSAYSGSATVSRSGAADAGVDEISALIVGEFVAGTHDPGGDPPSRRHPDFGHKRGPRADRGEPVPQHPQAPLITVGHDLAVQRR
ncbi:hypothetical protein [Micromonospora sp. RP3T]|uniref:hypothetical protein n=1 Tax=Micromonospora sp. RP3T TaxID=2135446 RepID=UPI001304B4CE|nr:hypothetical protein [Micromonospora sp. RP3T]